MHKTSLACREYGKRNRFCEVCKDYGVQVHHIRTRGAGGTDETTNLIALCPEHHTEIHRIGNKEFGIKYGIENRIQAALGEARYGRD